MTDLLLYQTSDPEFADRAIEALNEAGISSYRTGTGYMDITRQVPPNPEASVCIFLRRNEDYRRANEILIELGAVVDSPIKLPSRRILFVLAIALAVLAILIARSWEAR